MPKRKRELLSPKIREANIKDIFKIVDIEKKSFPKPWGANTFVIEFFKSSSRIFVAEEDGKIVGYVVFWFIKDEGYIANIAVDPSYRGKGIGSALIGKVLEFAEKMGLISITLEVRKSNEAARRLYDKFGFEVVGIRKRMYSDGEDGLVMEKILEYKDNINLIKEDANDGERNN